MSNLYKFRLQLSLVIYIILIVLLVLLKPKFTFDENGDLKRFGTNNGSNTTTILPLWLIIVLLAILSYYLTNLFIIFIK